MEGTHTLGQLKMGAHIHLIGICGTAMASLAGLLKARGFRITGSDLNPYPPMSTQLANLGIDIMQGYRQEHLRERPDLVIIGNVVSSGNPEAQEVMRLQIPFTSLPKAVGEFIIDDRESLVICGTHGKTTTTSLMTFVADQCGLKPGFLIGGIAKDFGVSFRNPQGRYFVIEGDEYDTAYFDKVPKFLHYKPRHVILTSIEFDHADIYKDLSAVKAAFSELLRRMPSQGTLVYHAGDENIHSLLDTCRATKRFSYGIEEGDYQASQLESLEIGTRFLVRLGGEILGQYFISMGGRYNVLNALAVIAMSHLLNFPMTQVAPALRNFAGVKRRQEVLGEPGGVLVIEDFAHHPTAVRETLLGIVARYAHRRVFAVFEPRSATSRRRVFQKDYVTAFEPAHEVLIAEAFDQSKIQAEDRFSSQELVEDLKNTGKSAQVFKTADEIVDFLVVAAKPRDIVLVMSNGGFDGIYQKLLNRLKREVVTSRV